MKRLALILGTTALAAISAPVSSATAQTGCSWWDVACRGMTNTVSDGGWHIAGRDANGDVIYVRRRVDSNGNVIIEQARRNDLGNYVITNNHRSLKQSYIGANGAICKYNENAKGYKEECKYAKTTRVKYHTVKYKAPKAIHYDNDVKGPKPHKVDFHAAKVHEGKAKGPKY